MATLADPASAIARLRLTAWRQASAGDAAAAAATLRHALSLAPDDADLLTAAADAHRFTGDLDEAIRLFDRALAIDPAQVAASYGRGLAHMAVGATAAARDDFARVTELAPATAPGFAGLAEAAAKLGDAEAARTAARTALRLNPNDAATLITLARCDLSQKQPSRAVGRLQGLLVKPTAAGDDVVVALGVLGDAFDSLGRVDEAFAAYASAKARVAARQGRDAPRVALMHAENVTTAVAALPPVDRPWSVAPVAGEAANHVFLLGYPRSGTTLVEQVLATVPGVTTLEEAPTLAAAAPLLGDLRTLAALDDDTVARLRADYWSRVAAAGGGGSTFVDMDPFKTIALPLIARLFPAAKVVVVRRDPHDVVWSCFRRTFVAGPVTDEFTSLPRAARHYVSTMRFIEQCRATLPLTVHELSYEALVADFDAVTQDLCAFAGLPWSPALRDFDATARRRRVKTASATQVRSPFFDGSGQWRRYAKYLAAVEPLLAGV
jgi:Tfp pilus assembly protein PilF